MLALLKFVDKTGFPPEVSVVVPAIRALVVGSIVSVVLPNDSTIIGSAVPPPFNCTENVSLAVELSSLDVAVTVTSTEPDASPTGVSTRLPLPSNDAVSFAESELET